MSGGASTRHLFQKISCLTKRALAFMLALLSSGSLSLAQVDPPSVGSATGNSGAISNLKAIPENFDIDRASDEELHQVGIPPRPNKEQEPSLFLAWHTMFSKHRIAAKLREDRSIFHGPTKATGRKVRPFGISATSPTWSGFVISNSSNVFSQIGATVDGSFIQPGPLSGCIVGPKNYHSAYWVGIDGFNDASAGISSPDVLQIGTEMDSNCASVTNYAWVEWYPRPQQVITNLPIHLGETVGVYVDVDSIAATPIYATFISNDTTYVALNLTPPAGTTLIGNTIEWIVERITLNGQVTNLASYGFNGWFGVYAKTNMQGGGIINYIPSNVPSGSVLWELNMTDQANTNCILSSPNLYSGTLSGYVVDSIWFESAYYGNGPFCR